MQSTAPGRAAPRSLAAAAAGREERAAAEGAQAEGTAAAVVGIAGAERPGEPELIHFLSHLFLNTLIWNTFQH